MRIYVTPLKTHVRDPHQPHLGYLPAEGEWKEDTFQWRRLEIAGDVAIADGPAAAAKSKPAKS